MQLEYLSRDQNPWLKCFLSPRLNELSGLLDAEGYLAGSLSIAPQPESRIREEGEVAIKNFSKAKTNEETKQNFERSLIKDDSKIV